MNTLEKRIESLEKSAKRWKLTALAAAVVGFCCGATENPKVVTFDEVRAKKFICVKDDGTYDFTAMGNGVLMAREIQLTKSNEKDAYCIIANTEAGGMIAVSNGRPEAFQTYISAGIVGITTNGKTKTIHGAN